MGYESKIFVVRKTSIIEEEERRYATILATFKLGKVCAFSNLFREKEATNCNVYEGDNDKPYLEDRYGEPLKEATLQETIEMIEKARDIDDVCAQWLLPLKAYLKELEYIYFDELTILHFGY